MAYDFQKHPRRSIRLKGYNYAQAGAYFVSICTQNRECLFGDVVEGEMRLNKMGATVADAWQWLGNQYDHVELDEFTMMPNHLHGIIVITDDGNGDGGGSRTVGRGGSRTAPTDDATSKRKPIGRLVGAFKTVSTKHINHLRQSPGVPVWQRNYYEHIIRDEGSLHCIREYIANNPLQWHLDRENPGIVKPGHSGDRPVAPTRDEAWRI